MAAVLAASATAPPLSVGLFGDWGSGKSFFMRRLRDRIQDLATASEDARRDGRDSLYCGRIAQIEFNAWHYMDADLWASLVCHVLDQLERHLTGGAQPPLERNKAELAAVELERASVDGQRARLEQQRAELAAQVRQAEAARMSRSMSVGDVARAAAQEVSDRVARDPEVRAVLSDLERDLDLRAGTLTPAGLQKQKDRLASAGGKIAHALRVAASSPGKLAMVAVYVAAPLAVVVVGWLAHQLAASLGGAITAAATAIQLYRKAAARARPLLAQVDAAIEFAERKEQELRAMSPAEVALRERQRALDVERERLDAERARLEARAVALRADLDRLARESTFRHYVIERAASDDYRKRLGVIATVHRDFRNLSERLRDDQTEPRIDRIVLYVDDLDRCPPSRVVEVLQAIHLILSFPLFVVVVGVDSGWLLRSLEAYYARQFGDGHGVATPPGAGDNDWASRPQHYLEKIFQIPFTLRPMSIDGFGAMVGGLLAPQIAVAAHAAGAAVVGGRAAAREDHGASAAPDRPPQASRAVVAGPALVDAPIDLVPRNLEILQSEVDHLGTLAALVPSPRAAKRLVNLYRIVRAGLDGDDLDRFVDDHYQLTQICLAAVVGCPDLATDWFARLFRGELCSAADLAPYLDRLAVTDPRAALIAERLRNCRDLDDWPYVLAVCRGAARYSFETGRLLRPQGPGSDASVGEVTAPLA